jgi:uncharacterized membrane-anchored protein
MIWRQEQTLRTGHVFKFQTEPVDPIDAFRGRYVALRFRSERIPLNCFAEAQSHDRLYAQLAANPEGWAEIARLSRTPTPDSFAVTVQWVADQEIHLTFPFDRYYLEEKQAPRAEEAYRANNRRNDKNQHSTYVTVRVLNGHAALENLYLDDLSIHDYLRKQ